MKRSIVAVALFVATPILAVSTPQDVRLPHAIARETPAPAVFSHWKHDSLHCYSCHPSVFPQARVGFTHAQMEEGRYCGSCHQGQTAKAVTAMRCEACHAK